MKHDASNKTPHLALIFTEDRNGEARRPFQGRSYVTKTKQPETGEYPKATQQSTALCALSLVALMAMSVRTLFTTGTGSHARCWSVGSLPTRLAIWRSAGASAIMLATPASAFPIGALFGGRP